MKAPPFTPREDARIIQFTEDALDPSIWPEFLPGRGIMELLARRKHLINEGYVDRPKPV